MTPRTVVVISPYFPPSSLAGVHRARHVAKHLPSVGWTPVILCVDERHYEEKLDWALADLVPNTVEVIKTGALPVKFTRRLGIGEISLRAWVPLRQAVFELLERRRVGAVLITGSPYYPMLLGSEIRRRFGTPIVLDFQDPWVSTRGMAAPIGSKAGVANRLAAILEPRALRSASFVTSVSDIQNAEMANRYSWLNSERMAAIPIGGDEDDYRSLRVTAGDTRDLEDGYIHLSYVGTFWPAAEQPVRVLLRAFARLRAAEPMLAAKVRLNFVGTNPAANGDETFLVQRLAEREGVADAVREIPRRLPYASAMGILTRSQGILLIGSDEPHYTASKIYPALMSGRPFLSLYHSASSAHSILSATGGGRAFAFATPAELSALEAPLAEALRTLAIAPESFGVVDRAAYAPFEARAVAERFGSIFDRLSTEHVPGSVIRQNVR